MRFIIYLFLSLVALYAVYAMIRHKGREIYTGSHVRVVNALMGEGWVKSVALLPTIVFYSDSTVMFMWLNLLVVVGDKEGVKHGLGEETEDKEGE